MPTFRHGKNTYFALGSQATPSTLVDISTYLKDVQFPRPVDVAETSAFGTTAKTYVVGLYSSSFSFNGQYDATLDTQLAALLGFETAISFAYGPGGNTSGYTKYTGTCYITSYDIQSGVGDIVAISVQAQVTGAVNKTTF